MKRSHILLAAVRCLWPARVPATATFKEEGRNERHVWGRFTYVTGSAAVSWNLQDGVFWNRGQIASERYFDHEGLHHGFEIERKKGGGVQWQVPWVRGHMHGIARQFDRTGSEILRTRFVRGSGVDLYSNGCGINELRMYRNNHRHGFERWGHPLLPYEESHFIRGKQSGVFRKWKGTKLEKGYPKYFVDDKEVTRAEYRRARKARPQLPRDDRRDDQRSRPLHPSLRRVWLRKDLRAYVMRVPTTDE